MAPAAADNDVTSDDVTRQPYLLAEVDRLIRAAIDDGDGVFGVFVVDKQSLNIAINDHQTADRGQITN